MHLLVVFLLLAWVSAQGTPTPTTDSSVPTVTLNYCTVVPVAGNESLGYYKYQNIRYAAVPTSDLRWAKPQWPPVETEVNNGSLADADVDCASEEDCLYLDVWAPANRTGKTLPVMVWIYGGGFTGGSKSQNTPEGLFSLSTDFVFVAFNYRLGITGLANGPTVLHEGATSNTALWDVQHAFQWTRKYIGAFGGDPEQITAVGFSAGASQVLFQMTRFAGHAEQLFARAYVMSPGFVPGAGHHHAEAARADMSTACVKSTLRRSPALPARCKKLTYQFQPRVDGDFVADTYEAQFYQKRFNFSGPLVISHEQHEANSQPWEGVNTTEDVATYLRIFFPAITDDVVEEALALYPEADYASPGLRFADMKQSFDLTAHDLAVTQALENKTWNAMVALGEATHGTDQSYYWYSTYTLSSVSNSSPTVASNSSVGPPAGGSSSVNSTIAIKMQKYLLSFVLTGDPNTLWADDKPYWPQYGNASTQLVFNSSFYLAEDDLANAKSLFWNKALWY
ncbi:Esterase [Rasamsonia emersonii CBS 393.64]|uniref:Esterase n=1 Tax=Rasamsonia emersonii (strain ATCC 16479 / CBS 393.64 / IMI 116815) TaxID=1408163 RepID=A0A0F4YY13_RASE3|nr:Esterase [Rasamsonia emersonii CBS 393.64]KKA22716.1 Esterase [Rasamsonia emersonii CBS 393.64]